MPTKGLLSQLFLSEPAGRFALGHVFSSGQGIDKPAKANDGIGHWRCDITDDNRLTWSKEVYELFGIPCGTQVERGDAVAQYSEQSKGVLDRLRAFAINRKCGFILDAVISAGGTSNQWIRLIAFPILEAGRVVGLQGLKRAL
jgi:hypothetical protein